MRLPAHEYLDRIGISYETRDFPPETPKGAASVAQTLGFREAQMVKTLIFATGAGERVLVMVPANRSAISGQLKRAVGSRDVKLARPEAVRETTGYEVGSVPPFHWQQEGFRSFCDVALTREAHLGVGAGVWGHEIVLTPDALLRASGAQVVPLTEPGAPEPS